MFHEHAVGQHNNIHQQSNYDHLPPPSESNLNAISAISLSIPRGKAVAMPSVRISEEEEKEIKRGQYGGEGDKPHLGGFTEFDVSECRKRFTYLYCKISYMIIHFRGFNLIHILHERLLVATSEHTHLVLP